MSLIAQNIHCQLTCRMLALDFHSEIENRFLRIPNDMGYDMEMGRDSFKGPVERSDISHFMAQECKASQRPVPLSTHPVYAFLSN